MEIQAMNDFVMMAGDDVVTDSRKVARHFGKRPADVLRAIRKTIRDMPDEIAKRNFAFSYEINHLANGKREKVCQMTKDGFMLLAMGFTGRKAMAVKLAFIEAFNRMAEFIRTQAMGAWERYNAAWLGYQHDRAHASRCGKDLSHWRQLKPEHMARLERLNPQLRLPLAA